MEENTMKHIAIILAIAIVFGGSFLIFKPSYPKIEEIMTTTTTTIQGSIFPSNNETSFYDIADPFLSLLPWIFLLPIIIVIFKAVFFDRY
jgi:hypothetical protein